MKTNFAKKIFKILTIAIFSVFILTLFNFETVKAETVVTTRLDGNDATITDVTETTYENRKGQTSGFGSGYITTREEKKSYYNYKGDGTDEQYGSTLLRESYYDDNGDIQTQSGYKRYNNDGQLEDYWGDADEGNFEGSTNNDSNNNTDNNSKFTYTLLQELPKEGGNLKENVTLKDYLTWAFRFTLALAGFLAVMMIVIGGVEYIISGANESSRSDAKKRINNAISGLVLALVSYLVLYTINPSLVDFENNQFFKEKTSNGNSSDGDIGGGSSSSVITEAEDLQFNFSSSSGNTGGTTGTW